MLERLVLEVKSHRVKVLSLLLCFVDPFSIQEQHAFVRMLETGSNHSLKIDEHEDQQPDHLDQAEIVEEG